VLIYMTGGAACVPGADIYVAVSQFTAEIAALTLPSCRVRLCRRRRYRLRMMSRDCPAGSSSWTCLMTQVGGAGQLMGWQAAFALQHTACQLLGDAANSKH
jgi:hypothetical protein